MQTSNEFKIKFGGELNLVDLRTFIASLSNTATIAEEINASLNSNKIIELKLKTLEPGSFIAGIKIKEIDRDQSTVFENTNNSDTASKIIAILANLNEYKKHVGSGKAVIVEEKDTQITIKNARGDLQIFDRSIYDLYNSNSTVSDSISNNYSVLEGDPSVTSFELLDKNNDSLFKANRESFEELATKSLLETSEKKSKIETAELRVHKLVFDPKYKWEFWYKGNKISANILDEDFFEGIDQDEKFGKGDVLIVELQTNLIFDKSVDTFLIESYQINRVIEHTPKEKARQLSLDDFEG
jgi:hypothetical protein